MTPAFGLFGGRASRQRACFDFLSKSGGTMRGVIVGLILAALTASVPAVSWAGAQDDFTSAVWKNDVAAAKRALDQGASPNTPLSDGSTPLVVAVAFGRADLAELLISHGADVNARGGPKELQVPPLGMAATTGSVEMAELLLNRGADLEAADSIGSTPIDEAAGQDRLKMVALLASRGANVNAKNSEGSTPLHFAAFNGHADVVRLLLALGADPWAKNGDGQTPYDIAAQSDKLSAADKADVLAALGPSVRPAAATSEETHGCPHTEEEVTAMFRRIAQQSGEKDPQVVFLMVQNELRMMGCPSAAAQ